MSVFKCSHLVGAVIPALLVALAGCTAPAVSPTSAQTPGVAPGSIPSAAPGAGGVAPNQLTARQAIQKLESEQDPLWLNAKREVDRSSEELAGQHAAELRRGISVQKIWKVPGKTPTVALTFDDGPHPEFTPRILDLLKQEGVKATFFVVGSQAEKYPDLLKRMHQEGHTVGNHTYHHVSLPKIPLEYAEDEIQACGDVIQRILGKPARFFRPPGGQYNDDIARSINQLGYVLTLWTDNPGDFEQPGTEQVVDRTLARVQPGGIILMHDGVEQTITALPAILDGLKQRGYRFVTMEQAAQELGLKSPTTSPPS